MCTIIYVLEINFESKLARQPNRWKRKKISLIKNYLLVHGMLKADGGGRMETGLHIVYLASR
jgi:hypothetical protein